MTKNISVFILLTMLIVTSSYSQIIKDYGVKIGVTKSNYTVKNPPTMIDGTERLVVEIPTGNLFSPFVSLFVNVMETNLLNIEIETAFITKGIRKKFDLYVFSPENPSGTSQKVDYFFEQTFKYLQFNVNGHLKYNIGSITTYLIAGPTADYLVETSGILLTEEQRKDFLIGYNLGIGVNLGKLFSQQIFVEAKFNGDFSKVTNQNSPEYWSKVWIFNIGTNL